MYDVPVDADRGNSKPGAGFCYWLRDGDVDVTVQIVATDDPSEIGPVDLVMFCVKTFDLDQAAEQIRPIVGDDTMVLSVLNGVDSIDRLTSSWEKTA